MKCVNGAATPRPRSLDARHWRQGPMFFERRDFDLEGRVIAERRRREDRDWRTQ